MPATERSVQTKSRPRAAKLTVDERLREAFPEIDIDQMAESSGPNNRHNLLEKWAATVRTVQWWLEN